MATSVAMASVHEKNSDGISDETTELILMKFHI